MEDLLDITALVRADFACKCGCGSDTVDYELTMLIEMMVEHWGQDINIISGHRCLKHNFEVGGAVHSQHLEGRAIDFTIGSVQPMEVYNFLIRCFPKQYGIGKYVTFTHIDTRTDGPARW